VIEMRPKLKVFLYGCIFLSSSIEYSPIMLTICTRGFFSTSSPSSPLSSSGSVLRLLAERTSRRWSRLSERRRL